MIFQDRKDAGQKLAQELKKHKLNNMIVLGLPRGGIPVAYEVAKELGAPLSLVAARKLGVPFHEELGFGAIAPNNTLYINEDLVRSLGITQDQINLVVEKESKELERRTQLYLGHKVLPDLKNKTVVLVDDGLATGVTMLAAIKYVKNFKPKEIILAVPVSAEDTLQNLSKEVDKVICLLSSKEFYAVGQWYGDFDQTSDEEVIRLLSMLQ